MVYLGYGFWKLKKMASNIAGVSFFAEYINISIELTITVGEGIVANLLFNHQFKSKIYLIQNIQNDWMDNIFLWL